MNDREIYLTWIPHGAPWSRWGKGVLFAHLNERSDRAPASDVRLHIAQVVPSAALDASYRENARSNDVAIIAELGANDVVQAGIELARLGFRPVPLFNALPSLGAIFRAAVNLDPIITSLVTLAPELAAVNLAVDAPPAFLLHAGRLGKSGPPAGWLDNRSICSRADFPSGAELHARGIRHVVVLQSDAATPVASDLHDVLISFQDGALELHVASVRAGTKPSAVRLKKPWLIVRGYRALGRATMTRTKEGAFGHAVPTGG